MRKFLVFATTLVISVAAWTQSDARPEILVLGTYHMANPGHDIYNMQADDVLSPKRQQEIGAAIEVLKKFHPTKIAVESDVFSGRVGKEYADYLAGKYTLSRNEIDQIGYRLAKELGHSKVYAIDVDGDFPMQHVNNYAKASGQTGKLDKITSGWGELVKAQGDFLRTHTVLDMLEFLNSDDRAKKDMGLYFAIVPFGEAGDYAAADLLAAWYQRNIRIYQNIVNLIESPNEKILVIYGSGHLAWLRQDIANDETVRLRKLSELTTK